MIKQQARSRKIHSRYILLIFSVLFLHCRLLTCFVYAQDNGKTAVLTKQIMGTAQATDLHSAFEALGGLYFSEHKYNEYVELLRDLAGKKASLEPAVDYYIALSRYNQLKYLEESQLWEEYFSSGNTYKDEIVSSLNKAVPGFSKGDPLSIYSRLLLWKFYKDEDRSLAEQALAALNNAISLYSAKATDPAPLKEAAQGLASYGEKAKAKEIYKTYAQTQASLEHTDEELKSIALAFYEEGNLDLARDFYELYFQRLRRDKLIPALVEAARLFAYKDNGRNDTDFAERLFKKIEEVGGKAAFNEDLLYLRGLNLEKSPAYPEAAAVYLELSGLYPQGKYTNEARFKAGAIFTYISDSLNQGKACFEALTKEKQANPYVASAFYQLGLLSQWGGDSVSARTYYDKAITLSGDNFSDTVAESRARLSEIDQARPIEYNLKVFLDACLNPGLLKLSPENTDLQLPATAKKETPVNISANFSFGPTGCMSVEARYLWSLDTGRSIPAAEQTSFTTQYADSGTKLIGLVIMSPTGAVAKGISFINIE